MLSDIEVRKAKPQDKPYKLSDERGLYLLITPKGGKLWRMNYRFDDKQKTLYIGVYPDVSLSDARERRDEARKQLKHGIDPSAAKQAAKAAAAELTTNSFGTIARRTKDWQKIGVTKDWGQKIGVMKRLGSKRLGSGLALTLLCKRQDLTPFFRARPDPVLS